MSRTLASSRYLGSQRSITACLLAAGTLTFGICTCAAQYKDYPRKEGKVQALRISEQKLFVLDGEIRGRSEWQGGVANKAGNDYGYELSRIRGGVLVRPTRWLSAYMQFQDTHALDLPLSVTSSNMRDSFDLRQGYLALHFKPKRFATTDVTAGRQELKIGDERVVGVSDWANNARSWDGFDLKLGDKNRVEVFSTSVVAIHPTSLDTHGAGLTFHGVTGNLTHLVPNSTVAPFVLLRRLPRVLDQQGHYGKENEVTAGAYVESLLGHGFDVSATGAVQRGSFANNSIYAGSAIVKAGYTAMAMTWKPRLQVQYDHATGNNRTDSSRIGTYDQLYPSNHNAFGLVDMFGFQNISQIRGNLELKPAEPLSVLIQAGSLHLSTGRDNVYSSSGGTLVKAPALGFSSNAVGTELDVSAKYVLHKYVVNQIGVGHFFPGAVMTQNGHKPPVTIVFFSMRYRFTLQ